MMKRFGIYTSFFEFLLIIFTISAVRGPKIEHDSQTGASASASGSFPIVLPHNELKQDGGKFYLEGDEKNTCLLYIESISVVLYNVKQKMSAWATINATSKGATYSGKIECPATHNTGQEFKISLQANAGGEGVSGYYIGDKKKVIFRLSKVDVDLIFNFTSSAYWELVNADVRTISLDGAEEGGVPSVDNTWRLVSGISSNNKGWIFTDNQSPAWNINGFKDYAFSCGRTSPIIWAKHDTDEKSLEHAVGLAFHNLQFQLNSTYISPDKKRMAKFGWRVNDCAPLLSIGTWMILVVAIIFIGVLSFGFLMLNSVQTMSRFDDPKQKQIIISSKEN
uniref:V-type proton ATPase subunit S1/VOA1 transmembrane domain-containing protein n=1 Tax=Meloidogyne enterolobii TaxID=390850 RepID=A0A6V7VDW3_MELEN|nr:unnamed protein product [Meloidogyne enterolobii]